jgi:tRNA nucleotidyltransferase (CCA-adding enzyme)
MKKTIADIQRRRLDEILLDERSIMRYSEVLPYLITELSACVGFEQKNIYHCYDVYEHTLHAIEEYQKSCNSRQQDIICKLTLLLHDIGKPESFTFDNRGGHFYGHCKKGEELSQKILARLDYPEFIVYKISRLVRIHDIKFSDVFEDGDNVRKLISSIGEEDFKRLLYIQEGDIKAHSDYKMQDKLNTLEMVWEIYNNIAKKNSEVLVE